MTTSLFKKTVIISLFWHLAFFSIFRVSSGIRFSPASHGGLFFWGSSLNNFGAPYGLTAKPMGWLGAHPYGASNHQGSLYTAALDQNKPVIPVTGYTLKPQARLSFLDKKQTVRRGIHGLTLAQPDKKSVVMFYPQLPYHFLLYFKDRQAVHIELAFSIAAMGQTNAIAIKRKISSGNLEADLLTARYLSHYLFIQQMGFPANTWQTVKIELSPKND